MNFPQFTGRAAVVNGTLYFIDDSQFTRQLLAYDPGTDTWTSRAPMISLRKDFGFASLGGLLYAVGGVVPFDASQPHSSGKTAVVEVYDPATNSWKPVHPMSVRRNALAVTGFNGLLYGIGGDVGVGNTDNNATALNEAYAP
jgi:hypothetical protein